MKSLELKNTISEIKHSLERLSDILNFQEKEAANLEID